MSKEVHTILSLFSGAGALDYAFELTGRFRTTLAVELQPEFCETIRMNQGAGLISRFPLLNEDIRTLEPIDVVNGLDSPRDLAGIIGGPPCESFSTMGKRKGRQDPRGMLGFEFARWVRKLPVRFFVMENVPQLATMEKGSILEDLLREFRTSGFAVASQILNAADYGAATVRRRIFIVGVRGEAALEFPEPTHVPGGTLWAGFGKHAYCTVRDALSGLPTPSFDQPGDPQGHFAIRHSPEVVERFSNLPPGGYDYKRKRSRLRWDRPSWSLVAGNLSGIRSHIHPSESRELTNRESARIQGFPDQFQFCGNHAAVGKQIANSVPIRLGQAVAEALAEHLRSIKTETPEVAQG